MSKCSHTLHSPWETYLHFIWKCTYHYPQTCTLKPHFSAIMDDFFGHHSLRKIDWKFRVDIIIQSLAFTQELRAENNILTTSLFSNRCSISNRNCRLDNHNSFRIHFYAHINNCLNSRSVKMLSTAVIVSQNRNNDKIRRLVCSLCIPCYGQVKFLLSKVHLNVVVLNRWFTVINHSNFLRNNNIYCDNFMMLS